ncbi:MAG: hypothetical protein IKY72_07290 [Bacteroidaceae bacterium]|nr:hypothetical protein [Bacteroidaceae bacterium]
MEVLLLFSFRNENSIVFVIVSVFVFVYLPPITSNLTEQKSFIFGLARCSEADAPLQR